MVDQSDPSRTMLRRLVEAYRPWVEHCIAELGIEAPGLEDALARGERWLEVTLRDLLSRPFAGQPRGPLEVFQEAMRFPTDVLAEAGVRPVRRDPAAERALPGDRYDLAPASTSALGEDVWRAHLAWGRAKAAAVAPMVEAASPLPDPPPEGAGGAAAAGPSESASPPPRAEEGVGGRGTHLEHGGRPQADRGGSGGHGGPEPSAGEGSFRAAAGPPEKRDVGLLSRDLMDRSKVEEAARQAGLALRPWKDGGEADRQVLVGLVDLGHPDADAVVSRLAKAGVPVYAYGPHVDDLALQRARSLGATDALPRSRFFRRLPELLPRLV